MKPSELIDTPEKWCQGCSARNIKGLAVKAESDKAVTFCMFGALIKTSEDENDKVFNSYNNEQIYRMIEKLGLRTHKDLFDWNDAPERTHAEVLALLKSLDL